MCKINIIFSLNISKNSKVKPFKSGTFIVKKFSIVNSISFIDIGLFSVSVSPSVNFDKLCFKKFAQSIGVVLNLSA